MLARSGRLPTRGAWAYEVKWDGFRAIVSTEGPVRVRSRRGWDMAPRLDFPAQLPVRGMFDGELVAFGADGKPDFPSLCERGCTAGRRSRSRLWSSTYSASTGVTLRGSPIASVGGSLRQVRSEPTGGASATVRPSAFLTGLALTPA
jgi:hypothetical protein